VMRTRSGKVVYLRGETKMGTVSSFVGLIIQIVENLHKNVVKKIKNIVEKSKVLKVST